MVVVGVGVGVDLLHTSSMNPSPLVCVEVKKTDTTSSTAFFMTTATVKALGLRC